MPVSLPAGPVAQPTASAWERCRPEPAHLAQFPTRNPKVVP
jgi:hypothetical protein